MSRVVGAYVCSRGVFAVEFERRRAGLEVVRTLGTPARLDSASAAADHLVSVLAAAEIRSANVAIAMRGFDLMHHILSFPPARDDLLASIVEREVRRLEPNLADPIVAWMPLPADPADQERNAQKHVLAAACPRQNIEALESALSAADHKLLHLTALPAAMQRLDEELVESKTTSALVAPLPDGAFIGFVLGGALRLVVEPPLPDSDTRPETSAIVEEVELGAMFVRQQFRGAQLDDLTFAQGADTFAEAERGLGERLGVPVRRLDLHGLSAASLAAMGAVLDSQSNRPLALAGASAGRSYSGATGLLRQASIAAVVVMALVGAWAIITAQSARNAATALQDARRRVDQEYFGLAPMQTTADQRRLINDAVAALRVAESDRLDLQNALAVVGAAVSAPVQLDSLHLERGTTGWIGDLAGSVTAPSNGAAVQALHDFYRTLPGRLPVEALSLDELAYVDPAAVDSRARVRFRLSFELKIGASDQ